MPTFVSLFYLDLNNGAEKLFIQRTRCLDRGKSVAYSFVPFECMGSCIYLRFEVLWDCSQFQSYNLAYLSNLILASPSYFVLALASHSNFKIVVWVSTFIIEEVMKSGRNYRHHQSSLPSRDLNYIFWTFAFWYGVHFCFCFSWLAEAFYWLQSPFCLRVCRLCRQMGNH